MLAIPLVAHYLTLDICRELPVASTEGDGASALVIETIGQAPQQSLMQAYRLNHRAIADALVAAPAKTPADPSHARYS